MLVRNPVCNRCTLFKKIASKVWNDIIRAHQVRIDEDEKGITRKIIIELKHFHKRCRSSGGLDVYAKPGYKEDAYGSDIDLFVEVNPNQYVWYALQAKLLKLNKTYTSLKDGFSTRNPTYQWEKLKHLQTLSGCKSYYLLYNGVEDYDYDGIDVCSKAFDERQFGCSLVEPSIVESFALKKDLRGEYISPSFDDFHPKDAQPWRILVCCKKRKEGLTKYDLETILKSNKDLGYNKMTSTDSEKESDYKEDVYDDSERIRKGKTNIITSAMRKSKWSPDYRIVHSIAK